MATAARTDKPRRAFHYTDDGIVCASCLSRQADAEPEGDTGAAFLAGKLERVAASELAPATVCSWCGH